MRVWNTSEGVAQKMAKPGDWETKPIPEKHVTIEYGRRFSEVSLYFDSHTRMCVYYSVAR